MNRDQLIIFMQAAECLNFTEVAIRNYITQPAVSRQIADLEKHLGVKLFQRAGHKVRLTDEGRLFLEETRKILSGMQEAEIKVRNLSEGLTGKITVCLINTSTFHLSRCLYEFTKKYPHVLIDIIMMKGEEMDQALQKGEFDFAFTDEMMYKEDERFDSVVTGVDRFHLVVPKAHPLDEMPRDLGALKDEPFVIINMFDAPTMHRKIMDICGNRGLVPNIICRYNRLEAVTIAIAAGVGITIMPGVFTRISPYSELKSFPLEGDDACLPSVAVWKKNSVNPAAPKFLEILLKKYSGK